MQFDFKKADKEDAEDCVYSEIFEGKENKPFVTKSFNKAPVDSESGGMPMGFWAVLIGASSLYYMNDHVSGAGWGLFCAFLMLKKKKGLMVFLLAFLGMMGMASGVTGAGWLLFFAFLV